MTPRPLFLVLALACPLPRAASAAEAVKDRCDMKAVEAAKKGVAGLGALDQRKVKKYFKHDEKRGYFVHPESEVCEKPVIAFVHEAAKSVPSAGWDAMALERQAGHLERVNGWYKTLDERAVAVKDPADRVINLGVGLGLIDDMEGKVRPHEDTVSHLRAELTGAEVAALPASIKSMYVEIPREGGAGSPGEALASYLAVRDALADHLAEVGRYTGFKASSINDGKAVDSTLFKKMDEALSKTTMRLIEPADAARKGFVEFVRSGKAMEGSKLCEGPCDTVAEWLKALEGDATVTGGIAADKAAEEKGEARGAKERGENGGRSAEAVAAALLPKELEGRLTLDQHNALLGRGWEYKGPDAEENGDPLYLREHTLANAANPDRGAMGPVKLHVDGSGAKSYCSGVGCYDKSPFSDEPSGGVFAGPSPAGPGGKDAAKPKAAAPGASEPKAVRPHEDPELAAQRAANTLTLYADADCRNDGTGAEYRFCPWVKAAFGKLSSSRGAQSRFRFVSANAAQDAEWRALYDSYNIDPPALVYREHGQIKAMRSPHFPDAATTEAKMTAFAAALDTGSYEPGIPGKRVKPRVEPPAPCGRGRPCGASVSSSDGGPPPDARHTGAFSGGRGRSSGGCRPGQPCGGGAPAAAPQAPRSVAAAPASVVKPRAVAAGGKACELWTAEGWNCPACNWLKGSGLLSRCSSLKTNGVARGGIPSHCPEGVPCLFIDGQFVPFRQIESRLR